MKPVLLATDGSPTATKAAETYKPRFLVIGSHGRGVVKRAVFGSVSTGVLHHAKCPVLVVRADPVEVKSPPKERTSVHVA